MSGIHGRGEEGCFSITIGGILAGKLKIEQLADKYEDDDTGDKINYTGRYLSHFAREIQI
jgi:hypothetical protein